MMFTQYIKCQNNLYILSEKTKDIKKIPLFPKNVVYFGFFTNEMECVRVKQESDHN